MVAGTQQLQQQPEHLQEQAPQDHPQPLPTAEEEAYKRNTDCVYFLASPLTCKKGAECEYRHSEYARVNPRDCWFWLNGNCLNLKCSFRHPPLDGLLGTPHAENTGSSSVTPIQTPAYPSTNAQLNPGKQAVPCIFFQKGLCLKGDRCAFLHGLPPSTTASKSPQPPSVTQPSQQPSTQKNNGGIERGPQEQKIPQPSISKPILVHPRAKIAAKDHEAIQVTQPPRSGLITNRNALPTTGSEDEARRYKVMDVHPALNGNSTSKSSHLHQVHVSGDHGFQNGKETDELLRESSPGFDVLVDDELRDSGYYHNEEQFGRTGGAPEGRNLNSVNEYDRNHSVSDVDRDRFHEGRGFDYDHLQGQYGWEQHRSSERMLVGPTDSDRRGYWKSDSPDRYDESDLRYRLSKQRRGNGLRSVVSNDNALGERSNRASFRRDSHHVGPKENSLSGRLHGRIKLPRRSPPVIDGGDGRYWGRSSPGRTPSSSYQARHRDEIKGRVEENYNNSGRNFRGLPRVRREMMDDGGPDFAPPKRLSELKGEKGGEIRERQSLGKSKSLDDHEQHEGSNLAFEGPKPLSEILKRKREAGATGKLPTNRGDGGNNNQIKTGERLNKKQREQEANNKGKSQSAPTTDAVGTEDGEDKVAANNESYLPLPETEEGMIYDDTMEDHELEGFGQRDDGNYEYEQYEDEEGDYNYEEGDNVVPEGEEYYYEEEEGEEGGGGDDLDKKTGVISS